MDATTSEAAAKCIMDHVRCKGTTIHAELIFTDEDGIKIAVITAREVSQVKVFSNRLYLEARGAIAGVL